MMIFNFTEFGIMLYFLDEETRSPLPEQVASVPDYIAIDLKQTNFNDNGTISHRVTAAKMAMYQDLGFTHFIDPTFTIFSDHGTWQLTAKEATLYNDNK